MKNSLPSLNAIRFFESAARHLSFTRAAEELFVTQGAVSKQIKLLEQQLDCQLFLRRGPQLVLTSHGERLLETVSSALDIIKLGVATLRRAADCTLTVSLLPSFGSYWLLPRLADFESHYPGISVRLASSYANIDFAVATDIDSAIRLGKGGWPGLAAHQITTDLMFPVCAPAVADSIRSIGDLRNQRLLVDSYPYDDWENWFAAAGHPYAAHERRFYDDTGAQIRGALEGRGVSLIREEFIRDYLDSGMLVRLFDVEFYSDIHYWFVYPQSRARDQKITHFRDWLLAQGKH